MSTLKISRPGAQGMSMGRTTQRFFAEGEQHEATHWQDARLAPDEVANQPPDPEGRFESFDVVPRRRRPVLAFMAIGAFLLIGVAAWTTAFQIMRTRPAVRAWVASVGSKMLPPSVEAPRQVAPTRAGVDNPAPGAVQAGVPVATPSPAEPSPSPPTAANLATEEVRNTDVDEPAAAAEATSAPTARSIDRNRPLRGYVWSPRAKTLVPADAPVNDPIGARGVDTTEGAQPPPSTPSPSSGQ